MNKTKPSVSANSLKDKKVEYPTKSFDETIPLSYRHTCKVEDGECTYAITNQVPLCPVDTLLDFKEIPKWSK